MRRVENETLGECFYCGVLPGGMKLYAFPKKDFRQKSAVLAVDFGSIDQQLILPDLGEGVQVPAGVAHFLEHRMFEKPEGDITERFHALGAQVNADTTFTSTEFFFSCTDHFEENLGLLLDFVLHPYFTAEGVAREREIISREIQLYRDSLEWVSFFNALGSLYPGHPLSTDIAGTLESIQQIDREVLERCYGRFYRPANMGLFVGGDIDVHRTRERVNAYMEDKDFPESDSPVHPVRQPLPVPTPVVQVAQLPVVQHHLSLAFGDRVNGMGGAPLLGRGLALELALDILFGPSSRFFNRHYEDGLIDAASFGSEVYLEPWFGVCLVGGEVQYPERLEEAVVEELRQALDGDLMERDFERAKRKVYGQLLQGFDQVENCVQLMHGAVSCGAQPFDYFAAYERLTVADVRDCLETCLDYRCYGFSRVDPSATEEPD